MLDEVTADLDFDEYRSHFRGNVFAKPRASHNCTRPVERDDTSSTHVRRQAPDNRPLTAAVCQRRESVPDRSVMYMCGVGVTTPADVGCLVHLIRFTPGSAIMRMKAFPMPREVCIATFFNLDAQIVGEWQSLIVHQRSSLACSDLSLRLVGRDASIAPRSSRSQRATFTSVRQLCMTRDNRMWALRFRLFSHRSGMPVGITDASTP